MREDNAKHVDPESHGGKFPNGKALNTHIATAVIFQRVDLSYFLLSQSAYRSLFRRNDEPGTASMQSSLAARSILHQAACAPHPRPDETRCLEMSRNFLCRLHFIGL